MTATVMETRAVSQRSPADAANHPKRAFTVAAPDATSVLLLGDFTQWQRRPIPMRQCIDSLWRAEVELAPGAHQYRYLVDGQWRDDPECRRRVPKGLGSQNCVCQIS